MASFLGREEEWVNPQTGEIKSPIRVGCIQYPDGGGEMYGVRVSERGSSCNPLEARECRQQRREERQYGPKVARELAEQRKRAREEHSRTECARRAKSQVRRLCRSYVLDHMVTLTFPGDGVQDYDRALRLVQDFIHDHGNRLYREVRAWLAVPELHPGGHGWHWHILVHNRFTSSQLAHLRQGWTDFLTRKGMPPSGGARYVRIDVKDWGTAAHAASYASKYVAKTFDGDDRTKGRKRFLRARSMTVQVERGGAASLREVKEAASQIGNPYVFDSLDADDWHGPRMVYASWDADRPPI